MVNMAEVLGIKNVNYIMLDIAGFPRVNIDEELLYYGEDYEQGIVEQPHVTVAANVLPMVEKKHVDMLDIDWPTTVTLDRPAFFEQDDKDIFVYKVVLAPELEKAHNTLLQLPHMTHFPEYNPHITLAYMKKMEPERMSFMVSEAMRHNGRVFEVHNINYGDMT